MRSRVEVGVLGPVELRVDGRALPLPRGRTRGLLALLALEAPRVVAMDRLVLALWGDAPPRTVTTAVHGLVSSLRKLLATVDATAPDVLVTASPGYRLDLPPDAIDAHRFRHGLDAARAIASPEERAGRLRQALAEWRGPALADVRDRSFAGAPAAALDELRLDAVEDGVAADLEAGRHAEVAAELDELVEANPFRERLVGLLMLSRYRCGRQAEALTAFMELRERMVAELGVEPGTDLQQLHRAVLAQDPALARPAADRAGDGGSVEDLTVQAGELLATAGARVYEERYDAAGAEALYARAEPLLPADHPRHAEVADRIPETHVMMGRHAEADRRLGDELRAARDAGDRRREHHLLLERARLLLITGPDPVPMATIEDLARRSLAVAVDQGDDVEVSRATYVLAVIAWRRLEMAAMLRVARTGLAAAERSGEPRERLAARWMLALALVDGDTPVAEALRECRQLADLGTGPHAGVLSEVARLHARRGDVEPARHAMTRAERWVEQHAELRRPAMWLSLRRGEVETLLGAPTRAVEPFRRALELADELGELDPSSHAAARLAMALADAGDPTAAASLVEVARSRAPAESARAHDIAATAATHVHHALTRT